MACVKGLTNQEDCNDCGACYTYGHNVCLQGFTELEDCTLCGACKHY